MKPQKWQLLSSRDVSPNKWFPIELRSYRLPNGNVVDDFTVTTLADVAMIVAVTKDHKVVLVNQYKPGVDAVVLQFPAGRKEIAHTDLLVTATHELEEETGIKAEASDFHHFATLSGFSTKATENVNLYFVENCEFNSLQHLDENENIEVVTLTPEEMDQKILNGEIWCAQTIAGWELAKKHFPQITSYA